MSDINVNVTDEIVQVDVTDEIIEVNVNNAQGPAGPAGANGQGVPVGGATGQVLKKLSNADYDTYWTIDGGGVPYSGASGDVDLGEYELKAGQIELDQTPTGTAGVAVTRWNDSVGTTETTLKGGNVVLKHGRDMFERIVNKTGVQLTKAAYQAVRVSTAQGQRLCVALAQANNDNNSADTIGLAVETIDNNQEGIIYTVGELDGVNTTGSLQGETWADGDVLYLSPTTPGRITNVKPVAPQHLVVIGYVVYAHQNNGKIYIKILNGFELGELHDVNTAGATNGQVLKYNGSIWVPATDTVGTGTVTSIATSSPLTGGTITTSGTIGINQASGSADGYLSSSDWTTFNGKQPQLNGTGFVKASGTTISYDNTTYQPLLTNPITGSAASGQVAYFTGATTQAGSNNLFWDATNSILGVGTNIPKAYSKLTVDGQSIFLSGTVMGVSQKIRFNNYYNSGTISDRAVSNGFAGSLWIDGSGNFIVYTTANSANADTNITETERLRITTSGVWGIGTNSPKSYSRLTVNGQLYAPDGFLSDGIFRLNNYYNSGTITDRAIITGYTGDLYLNTTTGFIFLRTSNSSITSDTNTTNVAKFAITPSGNIILQNGGTFTDGGQRLQVQGTTLLNGNTTISGSTTASSAIARGANITSTLVAAANNDVLVGLDVNPTFTNGAFTGVSNIGLRVGNVFNINNANQALNLICDTDNAQRGISVFQNNTGAQAAAMSFYKSRGTPSTPVNVTTNDLVGAFTFRPFIGGAYVQDRSLFGANMASTTGVGMFFIAGSTNSNYNPSIYIHPTSNVLIGSSQSILTGITDSGYRLDVNGTARVQGALTVSTGGADITTGSSLTYIRRDALNYCSIGIEPNGAVDFRINGTTKFYIGALSTNSIEIPQTLRIAFVNPGISTSSNILWDNANTTFRFANGNNTGLVSISSGNHTFQDATNIIVGTTTGTKIGTATSQKLSLWNAAPDVQPTTAITAAAFVANTSGIVDDTATFGGYTIGQIVAALKRIGALA